jgi:polysaccharide deacetylase 2 family uncharacterized protein YibQ
VLAVLLDDWGYTLAPMAGLAALPPAVSVAVFPGQAHSREVADQAFAQGRQVLVHLPLEPKADLPLIRGTLKSSMSEAELARTAESDFDSVPHAVGLNNHEGSKGTEDARIMHQVMELCLRHKVFFVDSMTTPRSVGMESARQAGVRSASRQVFLDDEDFIDAIELEFRKALYLAGRRGSCLAIGHPRPNTLQVLARLVPEAAAQGVALVPVSDLVR